MTDSLMGLIAGAAAEAQPRFACEDGDHFWPSEGGRCCSQAAYVCKVCGVYDYGNGTDCQGRFWRGPVDWRVGRLVNEA